MREVTRGGKSNNINPPAVKVQQSKPNHGWSFSLFFISSWLWKFVVLFHIHAWTHSPWGEVNDKKGCDLLSHMLFASDRHSFKCILNRLKYYWNTPPEFLLQWILSWRQNSTLQSRLVSVKEGTTARICSFIRCGNLIRCTLNLLRSKEV